MEPALVKPIAYPAVPLTSRDRPDYNRGVVENFLLIVTKPDNIPIVGMLFVVVFFIAWGLKEGRRNDKLIEQGRRDEIIKDMQR